MKRLLAIIMTLCMIFGLSSVGVWATDAWTSMTPMLSARVLFQTAVVDEKIYAIGGRDSGTGPVLTMEVYDPSNNTWTWKASMLTSRREFQAVVLNGKIYVIGGNGGGTLNRVEEYDPTTNTWTTKADMSTARENFQAEVIDGKIYVIGGNGNRGNSFATLSSVEVYDPTTNTWTTKASMSTGREFFQTTVLDGKIYAIGGSGASSSTSIASAEVYDPTANTWTVLASMSNARMNLKTVILDGKIYAIGGYNFGLGHLNSLEMYDPATNTWTTKASMSTPRYAHQAVTVNGQIYAFGGASTSGLTNTAEKYDSSTNTWATIASISEAKYFLESAVVGNDIYALGGSNVYSTGRNTVDKYATDTAPSSITSLTATINNDSVSLAWPSVTGATCYNVKRATSLDGAYTTISTGMTNTTYTDSSITSGTTYYYNVTAVNSAGESGFRITAVVYF